MLTALLSWVFQKYPGQLLQLPASLGFSGGLFVLGGRQKYPERALHLLILSNVLGQLVLVVLQRYLLQKPQVQVGLVLEVIPGSLVVLEPLAVLMQHVINCST